MNRAQRRKKIKNGMTMEDLRYIQNETKKEAVDQAVTSLTASFLLTLKDDFGFGAKRAQRLLEGVQNQFDAVTKGYISLDDMRETIEKELRISIKEEMKGEEQ